MSGLRDKGFKRFFTPIFLLCFGIVFLIFREDGYGSILRRDMAVQAGVDPLPLRIMVFDSSFVDIVLDVSEDFIARSGLKGNESGVIDISVVRKILMDYELEYARPIFAKRKEPVGNLKKQLSRLGILCVDYCEKCGTNENEAAKVRLTLCSPGGRKISCCSVTGISDLVKRGVDASKFGYNEHTLIDGHLLFYDDYVEKILKVSKDRDNRVILDMSDQLAVRELCSRFWFLLPQVDMIFFSAESARVFTGMSSLSAACKFLSKFQKLVVVRDDDLRIFFLSDSKDRGVYQRDFSSKEEAELFQSGFLFGYLSGERSEYCISCAESLSSEEDLA
ncbi:hypothetical protein [Chlamydiifrater phoenicopteri]|uniref:hypothetical protein n=1 Tax=Chlamydiifrater phoenicopteri TaxID=2681469 RepID=UPI001BCA9F62|nr:hypothetical protein [Chlamydiifrater phoenicopteri]